MAVIRWILARFILLADMLYRPKGIVRSAEEQGLLDQQTSHLALYQYKACPFCVKVRWAMRRNGFAIETRDAKQNATYGAELLAGGGTMKVPCLRVDHGQNKFEWIYESSDIITYLEQQFLSTEKPLTRQG